METLKEEAKNILDYWTALEMLIPNMFPNVRTETSDKVKYKLICDKISANENILSVLKKDSYIYPEYNRINSDIQICYGKFEIQNIYDLLYDRLHLEDVEIDVKSGFVCLFALKMTCKGSYIEESLDISPFIWAVNECINNESINVKKMQPSELYLLKNSYENYLMREEIPIERKIEHMYCELTTKLCGFIQDEEIYHADTGILIYDRVTNKAQEFVENMDIGEYTNLQQSYIIQDLEMVGSHIDDNEDITKYITAIKTPEKHLDIKSDFELIKAASKPELYSLGKWPSRYNPALMQQIAVNIACLNKDKDINAQDIFSVNGPPGTGKTTLIKEVIVDNIVNRAIKLTEYGNADDAFTECRFENKYDQFTTKYYKLDESLDCFAMLVASSNNNAVENITKELPKASDVEADKTLTGLFDTRIINDASACDNGGEDKKKKQVKEIYFTDLAQKMFGDDAWGLISIPLGNKRNIKKFGNDILREIIYTSNNNISLNCSEFQQAKVSFKNQLDEVLHCRTEIINYIQYEKASKKKLRTIEDEVELLEKQKSTAESELQDLINSLADITVSVENLKRQEEQLRMQCSEREETIRNLREEIIQWEGKLKFWERLWPKRFHSEKHTYISELSDKKTLKAQELEVYNQQLTTISDNLGNTNRQYNDILSETEKKKVCLKNVGDKLNLMLDEKEKCVREIEAFRQKRGLEGIKILSDVSDKRISEKEVQETSFYTSRKYDEAREKLFYEALQLHKWFVLSSSAMYTNFRILAKIWHMVNDANNKPYEFQSTEMNEAFEATFKSLFLFTPVISTTFAAVQSLLKPIRKPKSLGMLIIDEAGQATPQQAIGALWRCKKALIVGDPKQVQPVVTVPDCIYNVIGEGVDTEYHNKTISIQTFADKLNIYGGKIERCHAGDVALEWVGCPLVVHRRCIEPMFSISNEIAYNWTMVNATKQPKEDEKATLLYENSEWFQVSGSEKGNKNHYVREQGILALDMIIQGLHKQQALPDIYIISPFKSVAEEMRKLLKQSNELCEDKELDEWVKLHCGTVHTFQGKAANEVIFLLGCDASSKGAVNWVNVNIVNVAVTRAKYRLYVIGDYNIWKSSREFQIVKKYIDTYRICDEVN